MSAHSRPIGYRDSCVCCPGTDYVGASWNGEVEDTERGYIEWLGRKAGRAPWNWARLPGLGVGPGCLWEGGDFMPCGRACGCLKRTITSLRHDNAPERRSQSSTSGGAR